MHIDFDVTDLLIEIKSVNHKSEQWKSRQDNDVELFKDEYFARAILDYYIDMRVYRTNTWSRRVP